MSVQPTYGSSQDRRAKRPRHPGHAIVNDAHAPKARYSRTGRRAGTAATCHSADGGVHNFTDFTSLYKDELRFADDDEAEAVFGIVALRGSKGIKVRIDLTTCLLSGPCRALANRGKPFSSVQLWAETLSGR